MHSSASLYAATVLIWGTTWYAITFQLGTVALEVSVAYRFALAAGALFAWCRWRGLPLRFAPADHLRMALLGALLFSTNYLLFYRVTQSLTSGLVAVIFATIMPMNIVNAALLLRRPPSADVLAGAALGLAGLVLVFWPEVHATLARAEEVLAAVALGLLATYLVSLGNMVSASIQRRGLPVLQSNAWGMAYGAALMGLWALASGAHLGFDPRAGYVLSLGYLALFGSVLAFGCYLTLLGRIGPERAAYAMVLFPLVALALSSALEGYRWTPVSAAGVVTVLAGNLLIVSRPLRAALRAAVAGGAAAREAPAPPSGEAGERG